LPTFQISKKWEQLEWIDKVGEPDNGKIWMQELVVGVVIPGVRR